MTSCAKHSVTDNTKWFELFFADYAPCRRAQITVNLIKVAKTLRRCEASIEGINLPVNPDGLSDFEVLDFSKVKKIYWTYRTGIKHWGNTL